RPSPLLTHPYGPHAARPSFPTRRSSDLSPPSSGSGSGVVSLITRSVSAICCPNRKVIRNAMLSELKYASLLFADRTDPYTESTRSEEHTSELQSRENLVCRLLLE